MSRTPLVGCLVLCLLTFVPAATARADNGGPSPRRKAEIEALLARKRVDRARQARFYAMRNAQMDRQISEARAYEIYLAQAYASYQMSLERQSMIQASWVDRSSPSSSSASYWTPTVSPSALGLSGYSTGPVYVNLATAGSAPEVHHGSSSHSERSAHDRASAH